MPEKAAKSAKEEVAKAAEKEAAKAAGVSGADIIELFKEKLKKLQEENERLNRELVNVYEFIKSV